MKHLSRECGPNWGAERRQQDLDHKVFVDNFGRLVQRGVEVWSSAL